MEDVTTLSLGSEQAIFVEDVTTLGLGDLPHPISLACLNNLLRKCDKPLDDLSCLSSSILVALL